VPAPGPASDARIAGEQGVGERASNEQASEKQGAASAGNAAPIAAAVPTEPSPAHTPLVPPAGATEDGTVAASPATPPTETVPLPPEPFADELPPDFWGDALEPPAALQTAVDERFETVAATVAEPETATEPAHPPASARNASRALAGTLESNPRFVLLTELFPGRISDWQSAEVPAGTAAEDADDAPEVPETVDLEEGLDADETD
jgi:hypothetical protein